MDTISSIPKIDSERVKKMYQDNMEDVKMVLRLLNLTAAQLEVAEKLYVAGQ